MIGKNKMEFNNLQMNSIVEHYLKTVLLSEKQAQKITVAGVMYDSSKSRFIVSVDELTGATNEPER